ncbi:hypothetical protein MTO96_042098 [Rhipicephalus appendiculatus]
MSATKKSIWKSGLTADRKHTAEHSYYDGGHQTIHHNLYTHKYHNLYKEYDVVDYYFHRTAHFSGTINMATPVKPNTFLCTVSHKVRAGVSAIPPDGMCDLLYYDSFFTEEANNLTNGYRNLSPGTQFFLDRASLFGKTEFGASFAPS